MKNLILCADGTGNLGGTTPDSNVYRTYHLIERNEPAVPQFTYYDNGVGTATNKYLRAFTGAFGFGFKRNVLELYEYLARNYDPDDQVFLFGFSRGAAEVRALSGLIAAAGLVDGRKDDKATLDKKVQQAYHHYKHQQAGILFPNHGAIPLTFIGVWDTVSALGFPQHWKIAGIVSPVLNVLFFMLDWICDKTLFAHRFYNYELTPNVQHACQALAIDEERLSFEPKVWEEPRDGKTKVDQVWFAGAHSNVGGGYGRAGLSYIALEWMLSKAVPAGLEIKKGGLEEVQVQANAHGRLYNERNGLGVFYRYYPRLIADLWNQKNPSSSTPIKIHGSVFDRMGRRTGNYAPGHLPSTFSVVSENKPAKTITIQNQKWEELGKQLQTWTSLRSYLYGAFLDLFLALVGIALWLWISLPKGSPSGTAPAGWGMGILIHIADVLKYFLPKMFENLINLAVVEQPLYLGGASLIVLGMFILRGWVRKNYREVCEDLRGMLLSNPDLGGGGGSQPSKLTVELTSHQDPKVMETI